MAIIEYNKSPIEKTVLSKLSSAKGSANDAKRKSSNLICPSGFGYVNYIQSLYSTISTIEDNIKDIDRWIDDTISSYDKAGVEIESNISEFTVDDIVRETNNTNKLY